MQTLLNENQKDIKNKSYETTKKYLSKNISIKGLFKSLVDIGTYKANNDLLNNVLIVEGASKAEPGSGLYLLTQLACIEILKKHNKEKELNELSTGKKIACFCLTEKNAGSDISKIETKAKEAGNGYLLNGHKIWASNGSIADLFLIFAQTNEIGDKTGLTCFLSEISNLKIKEDTAKLGVKITPSNEIEIRDVGIKKEQVIGNIGDGGKIALEAISNGRVLCAAQAVGLLSGVLEESTKHAIKRNQFNKSISEYQAIQWYIADMQKDLDAAKLLLYKATWSKSNSPNEFNKLSSMAKYFCTEVAAKHSNKGVQILGGSGLEENSFVAKAYRDSKVLEIYEGTNEIQKLIIAKELNLK